MNIPWNWCYPTNPILSIPSWLSHPQWQSRANPGMQKKSPNHPIPCYIMLYIPISHVVSPYIIYTIQYMVNQRLIHIINPHPIHPQIHIDPHEYHHIPLDQLSQKHKKQHWKSLCFVHQIMIPDWSLPRCAWPPQSCTQRASVQRTSRRARWFHEFRREKAYETV